MTPRPEPRLLERYAGARVLVTGATGFKGTWLCAWLRHLGAEVSGLSLAPRDPGALSDRVALGDWVDDVRVDLRDPEATARRVAQVQPHLVFHLAAQALVPRSYAEPVQTIHTNVLGTVHLLDAVRRLGRPCGVVSVASDKCYAHPPGAAPHRETDPLGGDDPYSASKGAAELLTAAWRRSFFPPERLAEHGVAVATARAGNVLGPGDTAPGRLVPDFFRAVRASRPLELRRPGAVRPWQHVLEPLHGYLLLGQAVHPDRPAPARAAAGEAWNLGPGRDAEVPVHAVVDGLIAAWGAGRWVDASGAAQPAEVDALRLDASRAEARLGWRPRWGLSETLERLAVGTRRLDAAPDPAAARRVLLEEIAAYPVG